MSTYIYIDGWKSNLRFSSAHIIPEYEKCGRLHGHTYAVHAKVNGKCDKNGIIMDFSLLKDILKQITDELDHKVLIPEKNTNVKIEKDNSSVRISFLGKKYVFPLVDCVFLPVGSTTAENLAGYVLDKLQKNIDIPKNIESIEIGVDEGFGQGARLVKLFK
ncbi:MAG: 6-carboxytetrahydropterin synthase [Candidatus Thermoplasmatota archaeon]|nr:6-carboxytetrahydropterin synthase [Candidatus Thermoplasmatota archaeon]